LNTAYEHALSNLSVNKWSK